MIIYKKPYLLIYCLLALFALSCSKDDPEPDLPTGGGSDYDPEVPVEDVWTVNKPDQYAVNVVFFKPSDVTVDETTLNKISDMMLYIQGWYEVQMKRNGYDKTFGLVTNQNGKVRVHVLNDNQPASYYKDKETANPYSTLSETNSKVASFFSNNSGTKAGSHTIILSTEETLIRFVGSGKNAYARSTDYSLAPTGKSIDGFQLMSSDRLGGIMHELGHALNVPHNCHKSSDQPNVALMSFGNQTYEQGNEELVFFTDATSAILDVNEAFNKTTNGVAYYNINSMEISTYAVSRDLDQEIIHAEGIISSSTTVKHVYIGHDGGDSGSSNNNYDEVTFLASTESLGDGTYSFSVDMPYSELFNNYKDNEKGTMLLTFTSLSENGEKKDLYKYTYTIDLTTKTPNVDVEDSFEIFQLSDRSNWTVVANTTSPNSARDIKMLHDSDYSSYWRSKYPYDLSSDGPHQIDIDMSSEQTFTGVYLNSDSNNSNYFRPKNVTVLSSSNGSDYTELKQFEIDNEDIEQTLTMDTAITTRYLRILVTDVYHTNEPDESLLFNEIDIILE